jgi:hypothetical protein
MSHCACELFGDRLQPQLHAAHTLLRQQAEWGVRYAAALLQRQRNIHSQSSSSAPGPIPINSPRQIALPRTEALIDARRIPSEKGVYRWR